jgi:hypothetical protein
VVTLSKYQRDEIDKFLATLPGDAPLRAIVLGAEVQTNLAAFETADVRALTEQTRYWSWGRRGLRATTFGILVGALLLFPLDAWVAGVPRTIIGALQTLALAVTFGATLLITWLKPLDEWMSHRAKAEQLRGKIFAAVLDSAAPANTDAMTLLAQKLDLLLEAHLNDQLHYFDRGIRKHKASASKLSPLRLVGYALIVCAGTLGLAALAKGLSVPLPETLRRLVDWLLLPDANRWQLGIATIASGVLAHATARTLMDEDERRAALYAITASKLRKLMDRDLSKVRAAIAVGDDMALQKFFSDARGILEHEHAVWSFVQPSDDVADRAS